ncbi:MAG: phytase, partial [Acidimicrobiia bacterium]
MRLCLRAYPAAGCFLLSLVVLSLALFSAQPNHSLAAPVSVLATAETAPVPDAGDAADDVAIWIHPTDPSLSTVIGTDKLAGGGLGVYDLAGNQLYFYFHGNYNNVDLRYNFPLGSEPVALVGVSNRTDPISIEFYKVNVSDRSLTSVGEIPLTGLPISRPRGLAMYHSPVSGKYYTFTTDFNTNVVFQFELDGASGSVTGTLVRSFDNGNTSEGMVTDDHLQRLYVSEEDVGIWRYGAEPADGASRTLMDSIVASGGHLVNNVKNSAIYYRSDGTGYVVASSQGGGGSFQLYNRVDNAFVGEFKITSGINGVDGVNGQDGIDLTNFNLGPAFPQGIFVTQDHDNTNGGNGNSGNQNYKYVPWQSIASAFTPALPMVNTFDPRTIGDPGSPTPTPS